MKDNTSKLLAESYMETRRPKELSKTLDYIVIENIIEDIQLSEDIMVEEGIMDTIKGVGSAIKTGAQKVGGAVKGAVGGAIGKLIAPFVQKIAQGLDPQTQQRLANVAQDPNAFQAELAKVAKEGEAEAQQDLQKMDAQDGQAAQAQAVANDPAASAAGVPGTPGQAPAQVNASTEVTLGDYVKVYESYVREFQYIFKSESAREKLEEALSNLKRYAEGNEDTVVLEQDINLGNFAGLGNPQGTARTQAGLVVPSGMQGAAQGGAAAKKTAQPKALDPINVLTGIRKTLEKMGVDMADPSQYQVLQKFAGQIVANQQSANKAAGSGEAGGQGGMAQNFEKVKRWFTAPGNEKRGKVALGILVALLGAAALPAIAPTLAATFASIAVKGGAPILFKQFAP